MTVDDQQWVENMTAGELRGLVREIVQEEVSKVKLPNASLSEILSAEEIEQPEEDIIFLDGQKYYLPESVEDKVPDN
jgi:hypothetical protein